MKSMGTFLNHVKREGNTFGENEFEESSLPFFPPNLFYIFLCVLWSVAPNSFPQLDAGNYTSGDEMNQQAVSTSYPFFHSYNIRSVYG